MKVSEMLKVTSFFMIAALAACNLNLHAAEADAAQIARGKYLVRLGGCTDCHTPGHFFGKPDSARFLGGSDVGFEIPNVGAFAGPNLTPDKTTGLGNWTTQQIVTAMTTGVRPDKRVLVPIMPYAALSQLTTEDATAIAVFLKSLPPVQNKVPGPFVNGTKPSFFVFRLVPPEKPIARNER
jgi:mono/diheme cytochrome c family protein